MNTKVDIQKKGGEMFYSKVGGILKRYSSREKNYFMVTVNENKIAIEKTNFFSVDELTSYLIKNFKCTDWQLTNTRETIRLDNDQFKITVILIPLKVLKNEVLSQIISELESPEQEIEHIYDLSSNLGLSLIEVAQNMFSEEVKKRLTAEYFDLYYGEALLKLEYFDLFADDIFLITPQTVHIFEKI